MPDEPRESRRHVRVFARRPCGVVLQDRRHRLGRGVPLEGPHARQHLEQGAAEGEDVRAVVGRLSAHLFRSHVAGRPEDCPVIGVARPRGGGCVVGVLGGTPAALSREPEVQKLHAAVSGHEDVVGLQIAVDDSLRVGGREGLRDLDRVLDRLADGKGAGLELVAQRRALQQLRHRIGGSILPADVEERQDVRMIQRRNGPRLALEPGKRLGIRGHLPWQHLDRDVASEARVPGAVHLAHAPRPDGGEDLVRPETCSGCETHVMGGL